MANDDRRLREGFDDLLAVVDDGVDGEALKSLWVRRISSTVRSSTPGQPGARTVYPTFA
jgi:hypothetical protein